MIEERRPPMEYNFVSADSHINEAPDTFVEHLPSQFRDRGPRIVKDEDGTDVWVPEGPPPQPLKWTTNAAQYRASAEEWSLKKMATISVEEMMKGSYDPHVRLQDMDTDGIDAE